MKFLLSLMLLATPAMAVDFLDVPLRSVYDGDTFLIDLPSFPPIFGQIAVRIDGIDTAEIHAKRLCERRDASMGKVQLATLLYKTRVDLLGCRRDKYFRLLCRVVADQAIDVSSYMLQSGFARPYHGEKKTAWRCK